MFWGLIIGDGMYSSCAPIFNFFYTPPDGASTEYQISNHEFSDFLHTYFVIFRTTRMAREVFSLVIMGNVTHILPVLQWLEVVIAFVSSLILIFILILYCQGYHFVYRVLGLAFGVHSISHLLFHFILLHSINLSGYSAASVKTKTRWTLNTLQFSGFSRILSELSIQQSIPNFCEF